MSTRRILCISNGHGEDHIASRVAYELQQLGMEIVALPIVGTGNAYRKLGIEIIGPVQTMPSGGFVYMDPKQLLRDLKGGLGGLTVQQWRTLREWRSQVDLVLAVGDIVVQVFAWLSGAPYAFIGTAKSDYYLRDETGPYASWRRWLEATLHLKPGSVYLGIDRWLMRPPRCKGVFPRDRLTAQLLQRFGLPVFDLGNPMMDGLIPQEPQPDLLTSLSPEKPVILLLPGSRPPEAYLNFSTIASVTEAFMTLGADNSSTGDFAEPQFIAAIAPSLDLEELHRVWPQTLPPVRLIPGHFGACAHRADVAIAMAGTATEQCVGLGKPVVTIPGQGPQFTPAFAEAQQRLLGPSLYARSDSPAAAAALQELLQSPPDLSTNAQQRMGFPGASQRIATQIAHLLQSSPSSP